MFVDRDEPAGARPLFERALAIAEKASGAEHPLTRTIRENLRQAKEKKPTR
ncbi:MAG: tetratricopeptide repeat protein [Methylocella sp.]